jgi:sodium ion-translocating decarboxylase beta subunit
MKFRLKVDDRWYNAEIRDLNARPVEVWVDSEHFEVWPEAHGLVSQPSNHSQPKMVLLGAAGQFGIFGTLLLATALGFPLNEAASIGVIGAIDGPTSIFVASKLAPRLLAPIAVAAYSYMSLVPIIQPPIMKLLTTRAERSIKMEYAPRPVSKRARVLFSVVTTLIVGLLVPEATPLISMLMLGNLLRESGVVERLNRSAQTEIIKIAT